MSASGLMAAWLLVSALVYLALAAYVWRVRRAGGAKALALLLFAAGLWALCFSQELSAPGDTQARFWSDLKYPGYCFVAPALWAFVLGYTGGFTRRARWGVLALTLEPIAVLTMLAIPATHHLIHSYPDEAALQRYLGGAPRPHPGPLYGVHLTYTFVVNVLAAAVLVVRLGRLSGPFRRPGRLMIGAAVLPLIASIVSNVGLLPPHWPDPAPYLFLITGVVLVWGFFRLRLVDLLPGAWWQVVARMPVAVLVVDDEGRLLDGNPAARRLLGPGVGTGSHVGDAHPHLAPALSVDLGAGNAVCDIRVPALPLAGSRPAAEVEQVLDVDRGAAVMEAHVSAVEQPGLTSSARIVVLRDVTERRETEARLRTLLAEQTAVAQILRRCLEPTALPGVPGWEVAARTLAADTVADGRDAGSSGDFYDVHRTGDGAWAICLGEVAGRDVQAAALTALARSSVRAFSAQGLPVQDVVSGLNRVLLDGPVDDADRARACALVYARAVAGQAAHLQVAVGGTYPPLLRLPDGTVVPVAVPGPELGLRPDVRIDVTEVELPPGAVLLAYTAGLPDSRFHGERFGPGRLAVALQRAPGTAAGAAEAVLDAVRSFATQADDVAVVAVAATPG